MMIKKLTILLLCLMFFGCARHYEVPINVNITFPDCGDCEECLSELDELDFSDMVHIEVDATVKKEIDAGLELKGGSVW